MAILNTLLPTATLSDVGWTVTPSGSAYAVTSDYDDATYVTGSFSDPALILSVGLGPHGVPDGYMRHLTRVRVRGEDGSVAISVRLPDGDYIASSSITLPSSVDTINGSWSIGLPPSDSGSYGVVVTSYGSLVNVMQLYVDMDLRARPTFTMQILDAGTPTSAVTTTNSPTIKFNSINLDGLPARQWRAWVTSGSTIVWDSGIVAGVATSVDVDPLINGDYTAHAQILSTVGGSVAHPSEEVTESFTVNIQPVAGPTSITAAQRANTPLFDVTVGIPSGLGDYDDNTAYVELQRIDCSDDSEWSTVGLSLIPVSAVIEDFEDAVLSVAVTGVGSALWGRDPAHAHTGSYSLGSGIITDYESSVEYVAVPDDATTLYMWYMVSSEDGFDFFKAYADDAMIVSGSGEVAWTYLTVDVSSISILKFEYSKDGSLSEGEDAAWIDDLLFITGVASSVSFVDWTVPRTTATATCDSSEPCTFQYRARLAGLKSGVLVTSGWLYETNQTAQVVWDFDGSSANPTIELSCDATPFTGIGLTQQFVSPGYATDPITNASTGLNNTSFMAGIYYTGTADAGANPALNTLLRMSMLAARSDAATPHGFYIRTSHDDFATDVYASTVPTQRTTWTSYDFALNIPVTGTGITVHVHPYVAGAGEDIDIDQVTLTFGELVTHTLEWPVSDILLRTQDTSGVLWYSACGDVSWDTERPFTDDLGVMGAQKVISADPGGRDYTLNIAITSQEDVDALEVIFARQLVLISPFDVPEQWVAPTDQSIELIKIRQVYSTTIKTIGTGPEPAHSVQEVVS
jgi:hypothetical protein